MTYIGCGVMFLYWKMYRGFVCSKVLMVRILVLVIASDSPAHYVEMQQVWIQRCRTTEGGETSQERDTDVWKMRPLGTHLSKCLCQAPSCKEGARDIDVWFVKAKPERLWVGDIANDGPLSDTVEFDRDTMTIYVKGEETFIPGILNKTVEAIRAIGLEYDFVWRTNLSSVLDFDGLLRYCRLQTSHLNLSGGPVASLKEGELMSHPPPVASLKEGGVKRSFMPVTLGWPTSPPIRTLIPIFGLRLVLGFYYHERPFSI
jgi:hypothetical protein